VIHPNQLVRLGFTFMELCNTYIPIIGVKVGMPGTCDASKTISGVRVVCSVRL
jgi:hypothetical protein